MLYCNVTLQVTKGDIINVLPFGNVVQVVSMTGEKILEMLEWSVYNLNNRTSTGNLYGAYLQYGGLQVIENVNSKRLHINFHYVSYVISTCNLYLRNFLLLHLPYQVYARVICRWSMTRLNRRTRGWFPFKFNVPLAQYRRIVSFR